MANPVDIPKAIGEVAKLNTEVKTLATNIGLILAESRKVNTELAKVKKVTELNKLENEAKINAIKLQKAQNDLLLTNQKLVDATIKQKTLEIKAAQELEKKKALAIKTEDQLIKKKKTALDLTVKETKEKERLAAQQKKLNTVAKEQERAYVKLNNRHKEAVKLASDLAVQFGTGSKQAKKAANEANKLDRQLKKVDATLGKSQRRVGGYFGAIIKGAVSAGVAFIGFRTVFNVFKNSLNTLATFEEAMSKVRAVTGALPKEFKALSDNAKLLGGTTSKTATEVAGLQLEFSKLGFSTKEILAATEATISLSIAAGSDLANSAIVAASTVRGFGLDAAETQRIVDVMALSFASSALDLEKFKTGMAIAAPVAKSFGKDIEFTTARMSILADAGLDASTAGTSLRNIFLELTKNGLTWDEGLAKINNSTNKAATGLKLFGKRGVTAALILADNIEKAEDLEDAYDGAAGAAAKMARIMEDNLINDTKKLSSAWERFVLNLNKGEGKLTEFFRDAVQIVTKLVGKIDELNQTQEESKAAALQSQVNGEIEVFIGKLQEAIRLEEDIIDVRKLKNSLIDEEIKKEAELLTALIAKEDAEDDPARAFKIQDSIKFSQLLIEKLEGLKSILPEVTEEQEKLADAGERIENLTKIENEHIKIEKAITAFIKSELSERLGDQEQYTIELSDELLIRSEKEKAALDKSVEDARIAAEAKKELNKRILDEGVSAAQETGNILFDLAQSQRDRELESLGAEFEAKIAAAEGNQALQIRLAEELKTKQDELKAQQAQSEKNQALFNIAINTFQGISKAVAESPLTFGLPFSAFVAATGLLQAGAVASQPIPAFFKGTESAPAGLKWVADQGSEIANMPNGESILYTKPTLINTPGGEQILKHSDTVQELNKAIYNDIAVSGNEGIENRLDKMNHNLKNLKQLHLNADINGLSIHMKQGNSTIHYLNTVIGK